MIKEWLLARILKNKVVLFKQDNEYHVINDIYFDDFGAVVCTYVEFPEEIYGDNKSDFVELKE